MERIEGNVLGVDLQKTYDDGVVPKVGKYFHFTSIFRITPAFFIIGVQKGGTTSLSKYLEEHPQIVKAQRKDVFFFNNNSHYSKGLRWYKAHFALRPYQMLYNLKHATSSITYDSTPNYFDVDESAQRIHNFNPNAKIILLLRNPIDRAWSNYQMAKRFGFETLSFEEALEKEEDRLDLSKKIDAHNYIYQRLTYRKRGIYINSIKPWFNVFPKKNILILKNEDFYNNPLSVYRSVTDFLGLREFNNVNFEIYNKGSYKDEMNSVTRKRLADFYKPFNEELYRFLGVNYGWE